MQLSTELWGFAHGFPGRDLQFHSAKWSEEVMYRRAKIAVRCGVLIEGRAQDVAGLLLHGASVLGSPDA